MDIFDGREYWIEEEWQEVRLDKDDPLSASREKIRTTYFLSDIIVHKRKRMELVKDILDAAKIVTDKCDCRAYKNQFQMMGEVRDGWLVRAYIADKQQKEENNDNKQKLI